MANIIYIISGIIALLAVVIAFFRLIAGPTTADRVVALDAFTIISVSLIVLISVAAGRVIYIDVAMVYALISFVGVIAFVRYIMCTNWHIA